MSEDVLKSLDSFKNSPIDKRCLDICIDLDEAEFEERIPRWLSKVSKEGGYTKQDIRQFWLFRIDNADKTPKPKASLTQIPRILDRKGEKDIKGIEVVPSIEGQPSKLRFWQSRPGKKITRFATLKEEIDKWLPSFQNELGLEKLGGIWLRYTNDIGKNKHPELWPKDILSLNETLVFFQSSVPKLGDYVHPFHSESIQRINGREDTLFKTTFETSESGGFKVVFEYGSTQLPFERSVEEVDKEIEDAHRIILNQFSQHFTKDTLKYFRG